MGVCGETRVAEAKRASLLVTRIWRGAGAVGGARGGRVGVGSANTARVVCVCVRFFNTQKLYFVLFQLSFRASANAPSGSAPFSHFFVFRAQTAGTSDAAFVCGGIKLCAK